MILINFSDTVPTYSPSEISDFMFGPGPGTVADYWSESSYGQFTFTGDVSGWWTASQPHDYYGNNNYGQGGYNSYPANAHRLVEEAVDWAEASGVDFSQYDNNGDGCVDSLVIVHQGLPGEKTMDPSNIWSMAGRLSAGGGQSRYYDGVWVDAFAIVPEESFKGDRMVEAGSVAHEYGHLLGLPDLYDKDYSSMGVGLFDLMSAGVWGGDLSTPEWPVYPSVFTRMKLGWITPTVVGGSTQGAFTLEAIEDYPEVLKIPVDPAVPQEYYLVENREWIGNDALLPGRGLLIYHVDERSVLENRHELIGCGDQPPRLALEQADGLNQLELAENWGDSADFFPGPAGSAREFTHATSPSTVTHDCRLSGAAVTAISDAGPTMTLNVTTDDLRPARPEPWLIDGGLDWESLIGNGDTYLEAGESFRPLLTLINNGTTAGNVSAVLSSPSPYLLIGSTQLAFPDLGVGGQAVSTDGPEVTVLPGYRERRAIPLSFHVLYDGSSVDLARAIYPGRPDLLYVDDDGGAFTERHVAYQLKQRGFYFDQWSVEQSGSPQAADLAPYKQVIWVTGRVDSEPLSLSEVSALQGYLNGGGELILSSPYLLIAPGSTAARNFASTYLRVASFTDDGYAVDRIRGIANDPVSSNFNYDLINFDNPYYSRTTALTPGAAAAGAILNDRGHYTALRYPSIMPSTTYSSVLLSFGIENLSEKNLPELLVRLLNSFAYQTNQSFVSEVTSSSLRPKQVDTYIQMQGLNFNSKTRFALPDGDFDITLTESCGVGKMRILVNVHQDAATGWHDLVVISADGTTVHLQNLVQVEGDPLPNVPPVADAGTDLTVSHNGPASLDSSLSHDPDYDPISRLWVQESGPPVTLLPGATATIVTFNLDPTYLGDYHFILTVSDPWDQDGDSVTVTAINTAPVALAGPDQAGYRGDLITLDGRSTSDPDQDPLTLQWIQLEGPPVALLPSDTAALVQFTPDPAYAGFYRFQLTVADPWDQNGDTVAVEIYNHPPTALAGPDQGSTTGHLVCLDGSSSSDPEGDPLTYLWTQLTGSTVGLDLTDPARPCFTPPESGNYKFQLEVADPYDPCAVPDEVEIVAGSTENYPPVAEAGPNRTVDWFDPGPVSLDGSGSYDLDGDTLTFYWDLVSKPPDSLTELSDPASPTPTFDDDQPGDYVFQLRVNDGKVMSFPDQVTITSEMVYIDTDGDGIADYFDPDDDNDLMPDVWENAHGLDPLDPADGDPELESAVTDPDGDGNLNLSEFFNDSDPQLQDATTCGRGLGGCFFGDSNRNFVFESADLTSLKIVLLTGDAGSQAVPTNGDALDYDGNGVLTSADLTTLKARLIVPDLKILGAPSRIILLEPGSTVSAEEGDTVRISTRIVADHPALGPMPRAGAAVIYEVISGTARLLGGEASLPARHNLTPLDGVNTTDNEWSFALADDELEIIFSSLRTDGTGGYDLYRATRTERELPFQTPTLIAAVNTTEHETGPHLSPDGLSLYFARFNSALGTSWDLYLSTRPDHDSPFEEPVPLTELNTDGWDSEPTLTADLLTIYFSRYNGNNGYDIYRATRTDEASPFSTAEEVTEINSTAAERLPTVSADGLAIYFTSNRLGGKGGFDLWRAERASLNDPFSPPEPVEFVNSSADEYEARESLDGLRLYLSTGAYHATSDLDLFQVSRPTTTLPFWISDVPPRYEVTGTMAETERPESAGRAQVVLMPQGCDDVWVAAYFQEDLNRKLDAVALPELIHVQMSCP